MADLFADAGIKLEDRRLGVAKSSRGYHYWHDLRFFSYLFCFCPGSLPCFLEF
jgi:hypothetical protein